MCLRSLIALHPAAYLPFQIALRFAQLAQAKRGVVQAVQRSQIVDERFAQLSGSLRRQILKSAGRLLRMITPRTRSIT